MAWWTPSSGAASVPDGRWGLTAEVRIQKSEFRRQRSGVDTLRPVLSLAVLDSGSWILTSVLPKCWPPTCRPDLEGLLDDCRKCLGDQRESLLRRV
jgi:hypothetical protein